MGGGGCGAKASRPCGTTGEIAMKIISRTSRISIMGVMLISFLGPPEAPPTAIAIEVAPLNSDSKNYEFVIHRADDEPRAHNALTFCSAPSGPVQSAGRDSSTPPERRLSTTSSTFSYLARPSARRKTMSARAGLILKKIPYFGRKIFRIDSLQARAEKDLAIAGDRYLNRIFLLRVRQRNRIARLRQGYGVAVIEQWRDDHEDDQHDQHHVDHRGHVNVRYRWRGRF